MLGVSTKFMARPHLPPPASTMSRQSRKFRWWAK